MQNVSYRQGGIETGWAGNTVRVRIGTWRGREYVASGTIECEISPTRWFTPARVADSLAFHVGMAGRPLSRDEALAALKQIAQNNLTGSHMVRSLHVEVAS